jgi:mRNA turnover protein 4
LRRITLSETVNPTPIWLDSRDVHSGQQSPKRTLPAYRLVKCMMLHQELRGSHCGKLATSSYLHLPRRVQSGFQVDGRDAGAGAVDFLPWFTAKKYRRLDAHCHHRKVDSAVVKSRTCEYLGQRESGLTHAKLPKMPKSKRAKVFHLTQVKKKTREHKDALFANIREALPTYQYCWVFNIDNMRNNYLKDVRKELTDSRYDILTARSWIQYADKQRRGVHRLFFGKTKLTARALGTTPEDAQADGIDGLALFLHGSVGLLLTSREPAAIQSYFESRPADVDFARAGAIAPRTVVVQPGPLYATGGEVPSEDDVPIAAALEPELRRLGMPTKLVQGRVVLETAMDEHGDGRGGYTICKEGQVLEARQTRLLKLFSICLSYFEVKLLA